jgi:iron complex transport system substrate-binding protein
MLLGLGGMAGLGVLFGCGASSPGGSPDSPPPATPAGPSKIITLDPFSTYNLLDVGIVPVGVQSELAEGINPRYATTYADLPKTGTYFEPNLEMIASLAPDLILASTGQAELEPKLSQVARTILVTATTSSTWRTAAREVAAAAGRSEAMTGLEKAYEARAAEIATTHAGRLSELTWAMLWRGTAEGFSVRSAESNGGQVLALAGVRYNAVTQRAQGDTDTELSWEDIDEIADADVICVPGSTNGKPNAMTDLITSSKVFATLPAVKAGRVLTFDYMTPGSYLNATQLLDELATGLNTLT